jgi:PIN domain nuclease of toxin-antitoxin system
VIRLLDTHLLLWAAYEPDRLSETARQEIEDAATEPFFSAASIWEVSIKAGLGRADFTVDPRLFRRGLLENGYRELPVSSAHAAAVVDLPPVHRDPFDRLLVAQSRAEGIALLTNDAVVAQYGAPVRLV